jgi:hypothetical protein
MDTIDSFTVIDYSDHLNDYLHTLKGNNHHDYEKMTKDIRIFVYNHRTNPDFDNSFMLFLAEQIEQIRQKLDIYSVEPFQFIQWTGDNNTFSASEFLKIYEHLEYGNTVRMAEEIIQYVFPFTIGQAFEKRFQNDDKQNILDIQVVNFPSGYKGKITAGFDHVVNNTISKDDNLLSSLNYRMDLSSNEIGRFQNDLDNIQWIELELLPEPGKKTHAEILLIVKFTYRP